MINKMKSFSLFDSHLISLFFLCFFFDKSHADPRATEAALICTNRTALAPLRQIFIANFLATMDALTPLIAANRYGAVINGTGNATVYAFGECMRDLSQQDCNLCIAQCKTQILRCLPFQLLVRGGRLFYDGCYLRYDDYNFFNESLSLVNKTVCGGENFGGDLKVFNGNVVKLVKNLSLEAVKSDGFTVSSVDYANATVFGLGQCWKFIRGNSCSNCLNDAAKKIDSCPPKQEGRALNSGCYLRYSRERFYYNNTDSSSSSGNGGRSRLAIILSSVCAAVAVIVIIGTIAFFARKRVLKKNRERKQLGALLATVNKSKLNFSYEVLERATRYFDNSNKLGQGGSGSVYKGVLPDGKVVAIKRLFFNSRQWVDHFFNEVNLISNIDHKNLVKLLGCSITGPESLLVYEYVPNQSLHDYLTAEKNRPLSWDERFKIILGTAEGLAYLHEESEVRIIHRDIKLSNILLEDDFTPKIADFGLARLFPEDKTHISTAIAGTLGYMAPEYVVRGKLSEKADTYSFGVMITEVITGKRNNYFSQDRFSILQMVWNLYGSRNLREAVDPILDGNFREEEASRLLQIGLLCVQASAELRPAMSMVVKMVNGNIEIPLPTQPPFLNSTGSAEMFRAHIRLGNSKSLPDSKTQSSGNDWTQSWIEPR